MQKPTQTLRLDPDIMKRFKIHAIQTGKRYGELLEEIISDYLEAQEKKDQ